MKILLWVFVWIGKNYDNFADTIVIERPENEIDSTCVMIITDINGTVLDLSARR